MSDKRTPTPRQAREREASQPRKAMRRASPSEVLDILKPTAEDPQVIRFSGLWKTGLLPEPQGAA